MLTKRTSHCFSSETRFQHCPEHNSTPTRPSMVTSGTGGELVARDRLARSYFQFFTFISITTQDALAGLLRFTDTFGARLKIKNRISSIKAGISTRVVVQSGHTNFEHTGYFQTSCFFFSSVIKKKKKSFLINLDQVATHYYIFFFCILARGT
jgi:hypothetical protein